MTLAARPSVLKRASETQSRVRTRQVQLSGNPPTKIGPASGGEGEGEGGREADGGCWCSGADDERSHVRDRLGRGTLLRSGSWDDGCAA